MEQQKDIFISYGRGNENSLGSKQFVFELAEKLQALNYKVWLDKNDIPLATDYQDEIDKGIEISNNFIFIISPHAAKSVYCFKEIEKAVFLSKRIIPLLHIEPSQETVETSLHPVVRQLNWIPFTEADDPEKALESLREVLDMDMEHVNLHTHYLYKAREWESRNYRREFYLGGKQLKEAEAWLQNAYAMQSEPRPTDLHNDFIKRSRRRVQIKRLITSVASIALLLISMLSAMALWYSYREQLALQESLDNLKVAKSNAMLTSAFQIACDYSKKNALPVVAMAYKIAPNNPKVLASFYSTYYTSFSAENAPTHSSFSFSNKVSLKEKGIVFTEESGMIYLYDEKGQVLGIIQAEGGRSVTGLAFDNATQTLYANTDAGKTLAYPLDIEKLIASFENKGVPQVSDEMLNRYGIDKEAYSESVGTVSVPNADTVSSGSVSDADSASTLPTEVASLPSETTATLGEAVTAKKDSSQKVTTPVVKTSSELSYEELLDSKDVSLLAKGWKKYYDQYKSNKGSDEGREALSKAVHLAELASYQDQGNTKLMSSLGKSSGELAWEYLLAGEPKQAIRYSKQGLAVAPKQEWMLNHLLLGYMYDNQLPKALEVAEAINNRPYTFDSRYLTFNDALMAQLKELESKNKLSPLAQRIKDVLRVPLKAGYVEINNGVKSVSTPEVDLKIFAHGALEMMISNVPTFNDNTRWEPYQTTKKWTLIRSQGTKIVYVKFRDATGKESKPIKTSVNLLNIR